MSDNAADRCFGLAYDIWMATKNSSSAKLWDKMDQQSKNKVKNLAINSGKLSTRHVRYNGFNGDPEMAVNFNLVCTAITIFTMNGLSPTELTDYLSEKPCMSEKDFLALGTGVAEFEWVVGGKSVGVITSSENGDRAIMCANWLADKEYNAMAFEPWLLISSVKMLG